MVHETDLEIAVRGTDVRQYMAADALFRAVGDRDPMPYWKSAPYLVHFMRGYVFNRRLDEALGRSPDKVAKVLRSHRSAFLTRDHVLKWAALDPAQAKLRDLVQTLLDRGTLWRLLWMPPTLPYWAPEGPYRGAENASKTLMFSAWNVVPDVVSAMLSYEAERRMFGGRIPDYEDPDGQQRPLLRLGQTAEGNRSRHRLLLLLLPCLALADRAHPLAAPADGDRREWVRERVMKLLSDPRLPDPKEGPVDEQWEWAAPLLLDPSLRPFLQRWRRNKLHGYKETDDFPKPNPVVFDRYLDDLLDLDTRKLGRRPDRLVDHLAEVALGSPAVLAARAIAASGGAVSDETRRRLAVLIASAFWNLFNRPAVITLLRKMAPGERSAGDDPAYWRMVLEYCRHGNLQAVLDEQWHLLWDQHSWSIDEGDEAVAAMCAQALSQAVQPLRSRVHARFLDAQEAAIQRNELRIRTTFALRFGHGKAGSEGLSQDMVRAAFNSPFRPFVLTSTSIGQEGLDFHTWCHRIVHWNLPGNPVDLEQREGRVHRYKGHAVRRNVAASFGEKVLACRRPGKDPWALMFRMAHQRAREEGRPDLVPYWISDGDCRVERRVPLLPYTSEVASFRRLKKTARRLPGGVRPTASGRAARPPRPSRHGSRHPPRAHD